MSNSTQASARPSLSDNNGNTESYTPAQSAQTNAAQVQAEHLDTKARWDDAAVQARGKVPTPWHVDSMNSTPDAFPAL